MFIKIVRYWLPPLALAGLIFFLSSQPDLKSGLQPMYDLVLRKVGHAVIFGVLTFLIMRAFIQGHRYGLGEAALVALGLVVLYAVSDEYHQLFVFGRRGELSDVFIDMAGASLAAWLAIQKWRRPKRRRS